MDYHGSLRADRVEAINALLRRHFPDERLLVWDAYSEETTIQDLTKTKAAVRVSYEIENPDLVAFKIAIKALIHIWPVKRRVYHNLPCDTRIVKDPTWVIDAAAFSKANRRGTKFRHGSVGLEVVDVDRDTRHARVNGYNNIYVIKFIELNA